VDDNFSKDIKRLRSKAEQDYVQALIRFYNQNIAGLRTAIRQGKGVQANKNNKRTLPPEKQLSHTWRLRKL